MLEGGVIAPGATMSLMVNTTLPAAVAPPVSTTLAAAMVSVAPVV
jgi:hypothetical protein